MAIWVDAHLSPAISTSITSSLASEALALCDLNLRDSEDTEIFDAARAQKAIVMTKDSDFTQSLGDFERWRDISRD